MLITFRSAAGPDVLMLGPIGQQMLQLVGKDPADKQGIITVEQLSLASQALLAAFETDRTRQRATPPEPENEDEPAPRGMAAAVSLAQRIVPLLDLLKQAQQAAKPVLWEAT